MGHSRPLFEGLDLWMSARGLDLGGWSCVKVH